MKDLPDIALLAQTGPFTAAELHAALRATFPHRGTHPLPTALPPPPTSWSIPYVQMAKTHGLPWAGLNEVYSAARAFMDPVLAGGVGNWDPTQWSWK